MEINTFILVTLRLFQTITIDTYTAAEGPDRLWTFSGTCSGKNVTFGEPATAYFASDGVPSMQGQTCIVEKAGTDPDGTVHGSFSIQVQLKAGEIGFVYVQIQSLDGYLSNIAADYVEQTQ